ncbi:P subunit p29-like [Octopus vulgaris]|uniref:P subunit p29-like n=2 Tax=Octopus TaxID=6643 RepID=A0AA36AJQ1_OCTVU|nr:ribonuclease P protein subunit p29 [Octopus sinensis]XP_036360355.1 ribonuclease P protein subunit p29 [Octopus sinensis]XP_036360359.1 ribonuclease P protein subunit p29 [Octopus sinensis]CAI9715877.1 P subunit p29-like [Octopus vulgaris]
MSKSSTEHPYLPLPKEVLAKETELNILSQKDLQENFLANFLAQTVENPSHTLEIITEDQKIQSRWVDWRTQRHLTKSKHHKKTLSSKLRKQLKIFHIQPEVQKFHNFLPLHKLWKQYMKQLIQFENISPNNLMAVNLKVLKADYHGCYLTVSKSKCPSYVGTTGIVLMETKNIFKIITKDDKFKCIPKKNSVFCFSLDAYCFTLYGNHMKVKASERSHRKFKTKSTIDL